MDDNVKGYIAELNAQISILSERAASLSAALNKERADHEMAKARIRSYDKSDESQTE